MNTRYLNTTICLGATAFIMGVVCVTSARGDAGEKPITRLSAPNAAKAKLSIERGLAFLISDSAKWRSEHQCSTCHQGAMTVWALCEAKNQGYLSNPAPLADNVKWTKERLTDIGKPRDTRPGYNMVSTIAIYLAAMASVLPKQDSFTNDELKEISGHILRHQEEGGNWAWSLAPAQNRPPPVMESDEVITLWSYIALGTDTKEAVESRVKSVDWLSKTTQSDTTQADALRLLMKVRAGKHGRDIRSDIDRLKRRQIKDGGWSPTKELPSDAYATGQALYALNLAGVKNNQKVVKQGVEFLIANQKEDGSWPMTPRAHPGATPFKNPSPIVYFGSAWAAIGLMRSVPNSI